MVQAVHITGLDTGTSSAVVRNNRHVFDIHFMHNVAAINYAMFCNPYIMILEMYTLVHTCNARITCMT